MGDAPPHPVCMGSVPDEATGLGAVMVRPDGIVAWACDAGADPTGLAHALQRWFGPAAFLFLAAQVQRLVAALALARPDLHALVAAAFASGDVGRQVLEVR
ncbi:hypothetical protein G6F59_017325 [Rhizopus arrhizus]|nr:hypothetical protein G6F59_017325 [Rhizopus arrhizus]